MSEGCKNGPGRCERKGLTIMELFQMFPDDAAADLWFEQQRWPDGIRCTDCGSDRYGCVNHKTMPYRCKDCRHYFSVRKGSVMQSSKLGSQKWAIAIYMATTSLKGVSSMKLHRELGITQKAAWHMIQRIREIFRPDEIKLDGTIEIDETWMGGKRKNMHNAKRKLLKGRGPVGKTAVVGAAQRNGRIKAKPIQSTNTETLVGFVSESVKPGSAVYTDGASAYKAAKTVRHDSVNHKAQEYVRGDVHTNGIESFWSMLKRGYYGTFHKMSPKHLDRYVNEFAGRHNIRDLDTIEQMRKMARDMVGKRLTYKALIKDNGRASGARAA